MEWTGVIFEVARFLWLIFLLAVPIAISLTTAKKARAATRLVAGELLLTLLLAIGGLVKAAVSGSQTVGWDMIGVAYWAVPAFLVALVTGWIVGAIAVAIAVAEKV